MAFVEEFEVFDGGILLTASLVFKVGMLLAQDRVEFVSSLGLFDYVINKLCLFLGDSSKGGFNSSVSISDKPKFLFFFFEDFAGFFCFVLFCLQRFDLVIDDH